MTEDSSNVYLGINKIPKPTKLGENKPRFLKVIFI